MKIPFNSVLRSGVVLSLIFHLFLLSGCNEVDRTNIDLSLYVNGVLQNSTVPAKETEYGLVVDSRALAAGIPGMSFNKMLLFNGMVLQYGSTISFVGEGFSAGFAASQKVAMVPPMEISSGLTYWSPTSIFASTTGGTFTADLDHATLTADLPAPHEIGGTIPQAARVAHLLEDDFTIRQGDINLTSATEMYATGYLPDCNGNNAKNSYLVTQTPLSPRDTAYSGTPLGLKMDQDEAFLWIGYTPPSCSYYSYQHYLMSRYYPDMNPAQRKVYARLGDSINNYNISIKNAPYQKLIALIISGNQAVHDAVESAVQDIGIPAENILSLTLNAETVRFGFESDDDTLTFLHRATLFADDTQKSTYVNSPPLEILRLTPKKPKGKYTMAPPPGRVRQTFVREQDIAGLGGLLGDLQAAIIAKHGPNYKYTRLLKTSTWMYPGDGQAIMYGTNVLGETNDTLYLRSEEFILHEDDLIVVYGVYHPATGKSVYSNVSIYGAKAYNGVGGITSAPVTATAPSRVSYAGTGGDYLPGATAAQQAMIYSYKFSRTATDNTTFAIPYNKDQSYEGLNNGDLAFMGFRNYVDTSTTIGPFPGYVEDGRYFSYPADFSSEVYFDQAILFTNVNPDWN